MRKILIVDDQALNREQLKKVLQEDSYEIETVADGASALRMLSERSHHLVITDLRMPGMSGLELLSRVRERKPSVGLIVLTAYGDPGDAFTAMKAGADEFLTKPFDADHIRFRVRTVLERRRLIDELDQLRSQLKANYRGQMMVSKSPKMRKILI
jgi:DNA-binding NtrC family response regulator